MPPLPSLCLGGVCFQFSIVGYIFLVCKLLTWIKSLLSEPPWELLLTRVTILFYIPTSNVWIIQFSSLLPTFGVIIIFYFSNSDMCVVIFSCGFNFLMDNDIEHLVCLFDTYISSSVKCFFMCFAHFLIGLFEFVTAELWELWNIF